MTSRPRIGDDQRRVRLARRHGIAPAHRYGDVDAAVRAMTVLHATDAPTVYLSAWARVAGLDAADVDDALYVRRSLVKQLAMRRTLFACPRDLLPAVWGSASARVADAEQRRICAAIERAGLADDGAAWLERACAAALERLGDGPGCSTQQLRAQVPQIQGVVPMSPGKAYGRDVPVAGWVCTLLGLRGLIVRGTNDGGWRASRHAWVTTQRWLGRPPEPLSPEQGYARIVAAWLWTFGPGTAADVQWWLGATKTAAARAALDREAERLTGRLDGAVIGSPYASRQMRGERLP